MSSVLEGTLSLIGALGLFLYSVYRFGDGVQKIAGEKIRAILEKQSREPISSMLTGFGMAAALQSNSLTFGMISGLMNAGLLGLLPALWIMIGVNFGMTINAQLMALNVGAILFVLLFLGYLLNFYSKRRILHYLGQVIFSLALMYLGFSIFHQSFQIIVRNQPAAAFIKSIFLQPWYGFLLGLCLAALFRSSNTMVALIQAIVGVKLGLAPSIFLSGAFAVIIGANVGTTIINMLIGLDRLPTVKKANWMHFSFNITTGLLWLLFLPLAYQSVHQISLNLSSGFQWFRASVFQWPILSISISERWFNVWQLAMAHSLFNMSVIVIWFPVTIIASKFGFSPIVEKGKIGSNGKTYLDRRALQSPALALILASHEINQMASLTQEMLKMSRLAFLKNQIHLLDSIERNEVIVDDLQEQITFYLSALLSQNSLTEAQSRRLANLLHIVVDIERVGDHATNVSRLAEKKYQEQLPFSEIALNEIELFFGKVTDLYNKACQSLRENNSELAKQIKDREENIDKLEEEFRQNHIHRLNLGKCWPGSGVVYVELLSNLLRIASHSANIALKVLEEGETG
ncbi:MAG: Na/Pi cotransporter family protein [Bacteroidota bacterium]